MTESGVSLHRVSVPYDDPTAVRGYDQRDHYPYMFVQDAAQGLFPSWGDVNGQPVFRLSPEDEQVSRVIESAFAPVAYGGHGAGMSSTLSAFGNRAVHHLLDYSSDTYEVVPTVDANGQPIDFSIFRVDGARSFAGITWQTIPKTALTGAKWEETKP